MAIVKIIAHYYGQLSSKFGVPRQSGVVSKLQGRIVFEPEYRNPDALRGIEDFDYLWILWEFSENLKHNKSIASVGDDSGENLTFHPTVRPPRLGGNQRMGVFATRSPYHPNNIGLSSVKLERIEWNTSEGPALIVSGADLMSGTPIYDIKPYIEYSDSHVGTRSGFADKSKWHPLEVQYDAEILSELSLNEIETLVAILEQDPRPRYHKDTQRIYGMPFARWDVKFKVEEDVLRIVGLQSLRHR